MLSGASRTQAVTVPICWPCLESLFSGEEGTCQRMFYFLKRQLLWKLDHNFDQHC